MDPFNKIYPTISAGTIISYDPNEDLYIVKPDYIGNQTARALKLGAYKPYGASTRVLTCRTTGTNWVILGEIERAPASADTSALSVDEEVAASRGRTRNTGSVVGGRATDVAGIPQTPVFEGEVYLEAKNKKNIARAFIRLCTFGDIFVKASNLCFLHLSRIRNTLFVRCRDLRLKTLGYEHESVTSDDSKSISTINHKSVCSEDPILTERIGHVDLGDGIVNGSVEEGPKYRKELDTDTSTLRLAISDSRLSIGNLEAELGTHPVSGQSLEDHVTSSEPEGLVYKIGNTKIEAYPERLLASTDNYSLTITNELSLQVGTTTINIVDGVVSITANNIKVSATDNLELSAGTHMSLNAPTIDIVTNA